MTNEDCRDLNVAVKHEYSFCMRLCSYLFVYVCHTEQTVVSIHLVVIHVATAGTVTAGVYYEIAEKNHQKGSLEIDYFLDLNHCYSAAHSQISDVRPSLNAAATKQLYIL